MKNGIKALVVAFFITTLISCAFPATAMENCYVGMSGGISKIDNRIESIERREFRYSGDILLKTSEKRIGSPHRRVGRRTSGFCSSRRYGCFAAESCF